MWIIIVSNEKWKVTKLVYVNRTVPNVYSTHSFFSELSGLHELHINRKFFWLYLLWVLCASTSCYFNVEPRQQIGQLCFKRNSEFIKWITVLCAEFRWFVPWNTLSFTELLLKIPSVINSCFRGSNSKTRSHWSCMLQVIWHTHKDTGLTYGPFSRHVLASKEWT